ncbi:MAG TPA: SCO family protein [Pyrinomonadaceae bacterium]|nr:SCO family protein [Pyrinomonadaceae bacterium]
MRYLIIFISVIVLFTACQNPSTNTGAPSPTAKRYELRGKVISIDKAKKEATIEHQDIPGYMEAMTMPFPIRQDSVWDVLTPGSEIRADLVVDNANAQFWLENLSISAAPAAGQPTPPVNQYFAQVDKQVPNFELTNQDGKKIHFNDFRGKALAVTFIYRECPLPDYCIKMSRNFSDAANEIKQDNLYKDKIRLLSISFDPARDTPEKLRQYGLGYLGTASTPDFSVWQLAVGPDKDIRSIANFFGLQYQTDENDKTQINHSLVTAVISPEGKVTKVFTGNDWTPGDLLRELKATLPQNG